MSLEGYLFRRNGEWWKTEQRLRRSLAEWVQVLDKDILLNAPLDDLVARAVEEFGLRLPVLDEANIERNYREVGVSAEYEFAVPFTGDASLFHVTPTQCSQSPPEAAVTEDNCLVHRIRGTGIHPDHLKRVVEYFVQEVNKHLGWLARSVEPWNAGLPAQAKTLVEQRKQKLSYDLGVVDSLGFKPRRRLDASQTYTPPEIRRKVTPTPATRGSSAAEPALDADTYEHILKVLSDGAVLMERSPAAFRNMGEEAIRMVLLVLLNGHYEGQATGETFNAGGKTDILVRVDGRNVFIGECKLWGGAQKLAETIDQVLSYTAWRDTKAAVIVFNRNRDFSAVLAQVRPTVEAHPNYKAFLVQPSKTQFRFIFTRSDDPAREVTLTVLLFEVPTP